MVDVSSQNNSVSINVSTSGNSASIKATPDMAQYYSEKSREWATSNRIVDGIDYSSKHYANKANESATKAEKVIEDVKTEAQTQISTIQQVSQLEQEEIQEIINHIDNGKAVYMGEDEPTDPIYSVWVSPEDNNVDLEIQEIKEKLNKNDVDIDNIATDLNGKADTDLTNVTDQGKILMSSMGMPSDKYIDLTLGASKTTYTAPANGWVFLDKGGLAGQIGFIVNVTKKYAVGGAHFVRISCPVQKGDTYRVDYDLTGATSGFRFFYAVGSKSEAE